MVDIDVLLWCIYFLLSRPHTERYRSTLYALYLHGLSGDDSERAVWLQLNFLTCRAHTLLGQRDVNGFQSSCKINNFFMSFHSTFHFSSHYFWDTSLQSDLCLWLCLAHIPVCQSCVNQSKGQFKCEWMASVFLGSLALFPCCCTVELSWIYCIFFFEGEV